MSVADQLDLQGFIDHARGDLAEASAAIKRDDLETVFEKLASVGLRAKTKADQILEQLREAA